jgi:steroid 5-alpha reductase family enzyme
MFDFSMYLSALAVLLLAGIAGWIFSYAKQNVTIVDSLWALFFLLAALTCIALTPLPGPRATIIIVLVTVWAARLSGYLSWRNWGKPEDHRYQEIRRRNEPGFAFKSVYLVFGVQAVLAWIIAAPLVAGIASQTPLGLLDYVGIALWTVGFLFETVGDWQLTRFKANPDNQGKVMDRGLWRSTRHPNYFGEACLWWGTWLIAASAGGWWTIFSPLLMTVLLLKVSGVALLEKDISVRRPAYRDYIARTNAFFPGPHRRTLSDEKELA